MIHPEELDQQNLQQFNIDIKNKPDFIVEGQWKNVARFLSEIKVYIDEELEIINNSENIPDLLKNRVISYANTLISLLRDIYANNLGSANEASNKKQNTSQKINNWYNECFSKQNNQVFLTTYNTLKNLDKDNNEKEEIETLLSELKQEKASIEQKKEEAQKALESIKTIQSELQEKASEKVVSDYAGIFEDQSKEHTRKAENWLTAGILSSVGLFGVLFLIGYFDILPTENIDGILFTNIMIKAIVLAVIMFFISFSFRQYSINKHLATQNKHRQNGLNSYKLFTESISKDDTETNNALMLQLAKAIYEQTSTGYINSKNQGINSGIVEITKMMGKQVSSGQ